MKKEGARTEVGRLCCSGVRGLRHRRIEEKRRRQQRVRTFGRVRVKVVPGYAAHTVLAPSRITTENKKKKQRERHGGIDSDDRDCLRTEKPQRGRRLPRKRNIAEHNLSDGYGFGSWHEHGEHDGHGFLDRQGTVRGRKGLFVVFNFAHYLVVTR